MAEVGGEVIDDALVTLTLVESPADLQLPFSVVAGLQSRRKQPSNRGREHKLTTTTIGIHRPKCALNGGINKTMSSPMPKRTASTIE